MTNLKPKWKHGGPIRHGEPIRNINDVNEKNKT